LIPDLDICRSAALMLKRFGPDAAAPAALRADELFEGGDEHATAPCRAIVGAIEEPQRDRAHNGEQVQCQLHRSGPTIERLVGPE
jgi:hypothetical protein